MKKTKRVISKAKMYGIHPWVDQVDAIDQIVKDTGVKESIVLRRLLDEALIARRRKAADADPAERTPEHASSDRLSTIEDLLLQLVRQGDTSLRMQDISLALIQDTLAEARAGRKLTWEQTTHALKEQGLTKREVATKFDDDTEAAKDWSYGAAQEIKRQQKK